MSMPDSAPLFGAWPPKQNPPPQTFYRRIPECDRQVVWPPVSEQTKLNQLNSQNYSTMTLRDQVPLHKTEEVKFCSDAAATCRTPLKTCLHEIWPPKYPTSTLNRTGIVIPRCKRREFQCDQMLPRKVTSYRPVPGTMHVFLQDETKLK